MKITYSIEYYFTRTKITRRKQWRWRIKHPNGHIIAISSEGYNNKQDMIASLDNLLTFAGAKGLVTRVDVTK